jgi:hypothetical protein
MYPISLLASRRQNIAALATLILATALASVILATPAPAAASRLESEVLAPYVEIRQGDGIGSGVAITHQGKTRILTCSHIVSGEGPITLHQEDVMGQRWRWKAKLIKRTEITDEGSKADLALLSPNTPKDLTPARLPSSLRLVAGESCWYVGTPKGLHRSLERSIINRTRVQLWGGPRVLINGNGWYGNSGGPMYVNRDGRYVLAGIVSCLQRVTDQRTPMGCESHATIRAFLRGIK